MSYTISQLKQDLLNQKSAALTIVTANLRQSRMLKSRLAHTSKNAQVLPPIYSISEWINHLWMAQQLDLNPLSFARILSANESLWAWRKALQRFTDMPPLLDTPSLARQLGSAESIVEQYCLNLNETHGEHTDETRFFIDTLKLKREICQSWKAVTRDQAASRLIQGAPPPLPHSIVTYGFVDTPPLYQALIAKMSTDEVRELHENAMETVCTEVVLATEKDELQHALQWAQDLVEKEAQNVTIVIPDLNTCYASIQRKMHRALEPVGYLADTPEAPSQFDISVGDSLWNIKLIRDALTLFKLFDRHISADHANTLIASPYWGRQNREERALARQRLSKEARLAIPVAHFIQFFDVGEALDDHETSSYPFLIALRARRAQLFEKRRITDWVSWFIDSLKAVGWPGSQKLNSIEYQHSQAFITLLNELLSFASLDAELLSFSQFRELVEESCINKTAHVELKKPRLRVMGLMEAAGQPFEHCIVLGMTDKNLPLSAKPNPFLPLQLQKAGATPRSSADRELEYAHKLLYSLKASTQHLVLSRARRDELGDTRPSPLIKSLIDHSSSEMPLSDAPSMGIDRIISTCFNAIEFDRILTGHAPKMASGSVIKGGIAHCNAYWNNPLFSFFQYRLGVDKTQPIYMGLSPLKRGQLYHKVLESVYADYGDQRKLRDVIHSEALTPYLTQMIDTCWQNLKIGTLSPVIESHEKDKLRHVVVRFLSLDADREQPFTVQSLEQDYELELCSYRIQMRLDRIDLVDDGKQLVIDYKTGKNALSAISKRDTHDFQLPLYALALPTTAIHGVTFAELNEHQAKYLGVCSEHIRIPGILLPGKIRLSELPENWDDTLTHWKTNAVSLISSLTSGQIPYHPRNKSKAAFYHHFEQAVRSEEREQFNDH